MRLLNGLNEIAADYDGFIIDLWGVIHDGVTPYAGAADCLAKLRGRPVLLLSNAPRRAWAAQTMLRAMGIEDNFYTAILTSGEATWLALHQRTEPWFARLGSKILHIGPDRDRNIFTDLPVSLVDNPQAADFVVNTGPDDLNNATEMAVFVPILQACHAAGLPMICANPDIDVVRNGVRILCAGALAEYYATLGGDVASLGKPDPAIYDMALNMLGLPRRKILAIGDSLRTDIAGAEAAGLDSVWVLGGLHADEFGDDPKAPARAAAAAGLAPTAALRQFVW